jgi:gamma-glutamyltranspeptidase/glutathione hydrolase
MLGEIDLLVGPLEPGARMQSMMAPSIAFDDDGPALAIGAAGGTRLRAALVGVASAVLDCAVVPQEAVDRPRIYRAGTTVNAEPGADGAALAELERRGLAVRRWPARHHYFGGVSAVGRAGPAADPRRSGSAGTVPVGDSP